MHDQDPSDSPTLAAADLTEVAGMMRGLSALTVKRGRPLPLNDTSYTSEDLEAIASRLQQIADHFNDGRKTHPDRTDQGAGHAEGQGQGQAAVCQGSDRRPR